MDLFLFFFQVAFNMGKNPTQLPWGHLMEYIHIMSGTAKTYLKVFRKEQPVVEIHFDVWIPHIISESQPRVILFGALSGYLAIRTRNIYGESHFSREVYPEV